MYLVGIISLILYYFVRYMLEVDFPEYTYTVWRGLTLGVIAAHFIERVWKGNK